MRRLKNRIRAMLVRLLNEGLSGPQDLQSLVHREAVKDSAEYVYANLSRASIFSSREELWAHCLNEGNLKSKEQVTILEFGVYYAYSANWFADQLPRSQIFGFDSFQGLPEAWTGESGMNRGTFSLHGRLPDVRPNVTLVSGLFQETLPKFIEEETVRSVDFLHLDADLYSSTKFVLNQLADLIKPGLIICFDEYMMTSNWRNHEFKAWKEFVDEGNIDYEYIGFSGSQAAVRIR